MTRTPVRRFLESLTFDTLMESFGVERLAEALDRPLTILRGPMVPEPDTIRVESQGKAAEAGWYSREPQQVVTVVQVVTVEGADHVAVRCNCLSYVRCLHGDSLLVDLALSGPLREALRDGTPVGPALDALPPLRAAARGRLQAARLLEQWMPVAPRAHDQSYDLMMRVVDGGRDDVPVAERRDHPTLELRFQRVGDRTLLDPADMVLGGLSAHDLQVWRLGAPLSRARKGVELRGVGATMALQVLAEHPRPMRRDEKGGGDIRVSTTTVSLRVVAARRRRDEVVLSIDDLHARVTPRSMRRDERTAAPTAVVDALEARWEARVDNAVAWSRRARETVLFAGPHPFLWVPDASTFFPVDPGVDLAVAWQAHRHDTVEVPAEQSRWFYQQLRRRLTGRAVPLPPPEAVGLPPVEAPRMVLRIDGGALDVRARLEAVYRHGTHAVTPVHDESDGSREADTERSALRRVLEAGLRWSADLERYVVTDEDAVSFWQKGLPSLRGEHGAAMEILLAESLRNVQVRAPVRASMRVKLVEGMLDTTLQFSASELSADIAAMRDALTARRRWVTLDDGSLAEITESVAQLVREVDEVTDGASGSSVHATLKPHQLGRVERWIDEGVEGEVDDGVERFRARLREMAVRAEPEMPVGLNATLRAYQAQGLAWLQFLHALGAGGVLADDMGLGKTVQVLALIQWRREVDGPGPTLVVAPTSVAGNWIREAERFTPSLTRVLLHGLDRTRDAAAIAAADLVVTTYAVLRRDVEMLRGIRFRYVVLDEAQSVKNVDAQSTRAAGSLDAEATLALTGTPVENRLAELWSIMDLCNPGMLGTLRQFGQRYEKPIVMSPDGPEVRRLRAMVRPFLLRRAKHDVLRDLPPKEEIDQRCALGTTQRRMYDALAALVRQEVAKSIERTSVERSQIQVLTALLRLRQVACDPRLVDPKVSPESSTKRVAFLELVEALAAEGRRVLVFSQFVELLTLWRQDLDARKIRYEYLDGSTRARQDVVDRFQDGDAPLFLISLKAGGTGLNLTAADTVIHCDPWWNPAVEDQATDRAHRIGQTRSVTVYRLVARGTVEEKIIELKARKKELAEAVISGSEGALQGLTRDDVDALLGGVDDVLGEDEVTDEGPETPTRRGPRAAR